tara:strand:- start:386 stop:916 length:531 start_codon:yes stop_codon:yes gene_type:complete
MSTRTIFDVLFTTKKSKTYQQAVDSLSRVRDIVSSVSIEYPDVSSKDISIIQNKWVSLDEPVGNGVHTMGLHLEDDYRSLLVHYQEDSFLLPHFHSKEWEMLIVLDGEAQDLTTGTTLKKGDVYVIPRGAVHQVVTKSKECYMYVMFSSNGNHLKISDSDKEIAKAMIGKKHSFKA